MSPAIISKNGASNFTDTKIVTDGVALQLENDKSTFNRTTIFAGSNIDYSELAASLNLPHDVPLDLLREAVGQIKDSKNPGLIEQSELKTWLHENGFNMACWAQVALSLVTFAFSG